MRRSSARAATIRRNEFIIGSGPDALLCRYKSGRRMLDAQDQITLEFAGAFRHYHAAIMRTVIVGEPRPLHLAYHEAAREALLACEAELRPGRTAGDVFAAHARVLDAHGLSQHRLNACGYSLGAKFTPSWMDWPMFYEGNPWPIEPGMVCFAHMILMDSRDRDRHVPRPDLDRHRDRRTARRPGQSGPRGPVSVQG